MYFLPRADRKEYPPHKLVFETLTIMQQQCVLSTDCGKVRKAVAELGAHSTTVRTRLSKGL